MADETVKGPVTADMLEPGKEIQVGDCRVRFDYDMDIEAPWEETPSDFLPVLLFETNRRMECFQIGAGRHEDWLAGGGLDMVPLDVIASHRESLLGLVCDNREELEELQEYDSEYRQVYRGGDYDEREMLREFLWKKLEEKRPDPKYGEYERPHEAMRDWFGRLEGLFCEVGIPAEEFRVTTAREVTSCLAVLTPKWHAEAPGAAERPSPDGLLHKKVAEFSEVYRKYRNGEVYLVDVFSEAGDIPVDACGGFYDREEAAAFASETVQGFEADAEADPEP